MTESDDRKRHAQSISTVRAWWRGPGSAAVHAMVPHDVRDALDHIAYYGPEIVDALSGETSPASTETNVSSVPPSSELFGQPLPVTYPEPVFNEDGFGVGFRIVHPPGVECVFPPNTKQCSCGRMEVGVV